MGWVAPLDRTGSDTFHRALGQSSIATWGGDAAGAGVIWPAGPLRYSHPAATAAPRPRCRARTPPQSGRGELVLPAGTDGERLKAYRPSVSRACADQANLAK